MGLRRARYETRICPKSEIDAGWPDYSMRVRFPTNAMLKHLNSTLAASTAALCLCGLVLIAGATSTRAQFLCSNGTNADGATAAGIANVACGTNASASGGG